MIRYFLSSKTSQFKNKLLSDHCQIALWLETNEVISQTNAKSTYVWTKLLPGCKWNKNSETKFKQVLNTPKFCSIIEKFNKNELKLAVNINQTCQRTEILKIRNGLTGIVMINANNLDILQI